MISKTGTSESQRVVSGPEMLQRAAMDAIREARYRPYRLNGEAVEVERNSDYGEFFELAGKWMTDESKYKCGGLSIASAKVRRLRSG